MNIVVATDINNGIGKDNTIPWDLKADLSFFRQLTTAAQKDKINVMVMGRKTFESIGRILPNRITIVLTRTPIPGVLTIPSMTALQPMLSTLHNIDQVFIVGGQQVYEEALKTLPIQTIYKTVLHKYYECDRFFPDVSKTHEQVSQTPTYRENDILYHIEILRSIAWKYNLPNSILTCLTFSALTVALTT